ncbi:MAG: ABC transporter ATP-binding protein [Halieaceae bacterium]|nr:ABC transporter ATP-binding protein [Halieaceae bacterium]
MTTALAIKNLHKVYGNGVEALKGISLSVEEGDFYALLGPNGAGKSTVIGILFSLINKTAGSVEVFGIDIDKNFPQAKKALGIVPQEFNFNMFERVFDIVVTQGGYYGLPQKLARERAENYLKELGLWEKRDSQARELSGGMKRRLMIARSLVHQPRLLVLDEPTAGVDIEMRRTMWDFLRSINAAGTTIILTTHYLDEAETLCRNIAIIDEGRIIQHSGIREFLQQLRTEKFILDLRQELPADFSPGFPCEVVDQHTLEVMVDKDQGLNALFRAISAEGLEVASMRNKSNRLEEMFVTLLADSADERADE